LKKWVDAQERRDWATFEKDRRLAEDAEIGARAMRLLNMMIDQPENKQRRLESQLVSLESKAEILEAVQTAESDDMLQSWRWVHENCGGEAGCIQFDRSLQRGLTNITDLILLSQTEGEEKLAGWRHEHRELQHELHSVGSVGIIGIQAEAAVRKLGRRLASLEQKAAARQKVRQDALGGLYAMMKGSLVQQGLVEGQARAPTISSGGSSSVVHNDPIDWLMYR
jgi:hypothetical protein